jgi:hypothetical protein
LLAPITTSSHQEIHQHYSTKLPLKLRKLHDTDFNQHKTPRKDGDHTYIQHVSSPNYTRQNTSKLDQSSREFLLKEELVFKILY